MTDITILSVGQMATNCYIVGPVIIDPGDDAEYIIDHVRQKPKLIIATHGHFDHIMAAFAIQKTYNIPVYIHLSDTFLVHRMRESARHFLGITTDPPPEITPITNDTYEGLRVIHTPGHTPGSICLAYDEVLFSGDTIFKGGEVGRIDHRYSSVFDLGRSLSRILSNPPQTQLLCGHGEPSTVGEESRFHVQ